MDYVIEATRAWIGAERLSRLLRERGCPVSPETINGWTDWQKNLAETWTDGTPCTRIGRWLFGVPAKPDFLP